MEDDTYLKEGHVVWIDDPYNGFYKIVRREPFQYTTGDEDTAIYTAIASGAESGFKNIEELEPDNKPLHLFQVLWGVQHCGDIKYYLKNPAGQNRYGTDEDKEIGYINADLSPYIEMDALYQFYLINEWYPAINCVNNSPVTITPKIWFKGMKYDIEKIDYSASAPHRKIIFGGVKNTP